MRNNLRTKSLDKIEKVRYDNRITMCGYGAAFTLMALASLYNKDYEFRSLSYSNSGQIMNKFEGYTVGYFAVGILV